MTRPRVVRPLALLTAAVLAAGLAAGLAARTPVQPAPQAVADRAFAALTSGLETGQWNAWFDLLDDRFTFWFPTGKYLGQHTGKAEAMTFFKYVSSAFPGGLKVVEVLGRTGGGNTFVYEFRDEGQLRGEPYKNRVAISLDVCGERICGYREYFGSDGKVN